MYMILFFEFFKNNLFQKSRTKTHIHFVEKNPENSLKTMHMGIFGHNFRVWTSTKHRPILYENNEKIFVFLMGGEIPFEAERIFEVFFFWTSLIFKKLY